MTSNDAHAHSCQAIKAHAATPRSWWRGTRRIRIPRSTRERCRESRGGSHVQAGSCAGAWVRPSKATGNGRVPFTCAEDFGMFGNCRTIQTEEQLFIQFFPGPQSVNRISISLSNSKPDCGVTIVISPPTSSALCLCAQTLGNSRQSARRPHPGGRSVSSVVSQK